MSNLDDELEYVRRCEIADKHKLYKELRGTIARCHREWPKCRDCQGELAVTGVVPQTNTRTNKRFAVIILKCLGCKKLTSFSSASVTKWEDTAIGEGLIFEGETP